jgi:surface protein
MLVLLWAPRLALEQTPSRLLLTNINTSNVNSAADAWLSDSFDAIVTYGDISLWDTSTVTSLFATFNDATAFNQDISGWDTSSVTTLFKTFHKAEFFNQDIGMWDTLGVTTFYYTFSVATAFNQDIRRWMEYFVSDDFDGHIQLCENFQPEYWQLGHLSSVFFVSHIRPSLQLQSLYW